MTVGRVREIWRSPVKSMAGERLDYSLSDVADRYSVGQDS
jgi:hypothetical protein